VLLMAINSSNIGLIIMVFSPISPAFFIIGLAFVVSAIIGIPAFLSLVSRQVEKDEVGKILGAFFSITTIAIAIGSVVYSTIFSAVGSGGACGRDSDLSLVWLPWGVGAIAITISNWLFRRWANKFDESHDDIAQPFKEFNVVTNPIRITDEGASADTTNITVHRAGDQQKNSVKLETLNETELNSQKIISM